MAKDWDPNAPGGFNFEESKRADHAARVKADREFGWQMQAAAGSGFAKDALAVNGKSAWFGSSEKK